MELDEYRRYVQELASKHDGTPIFNSSLDHASIVVERLFSEAGQQIDVLSGNLNARVYGRNRVIDAAQGFLGTSANNRLRIILEQDSSADRAVHPFFRACAEHPGVELRIAPPAVRDSYEFHFVLTDGNNYRFEDDKTKSAAIAAFGHREGAKNLGSIYASLWEACRPVGII